MSEKVDGIERKYTRLLRRCATRIIEEFQDQRSGYTERWDCTLEQALANEEPEVAELVRAHQEDRVSECARCKAQAPLRDGRCVWGCELTASVNPSGQTLRMR